jgi:C-terminal processing protease CtpA/Prc
MCAHVCFSGGIENDLVPRVAVIDSKARITGKLMPGDLILQVDGTLVAGEPHTVAEDLIKVQR